MCEKRYSQWTAAHFSFTKFVACGLLLLLQVRIMSLDPEDVMSVLALQAVQAVPESLLLIDSPAADIGGKAEDDTGAGALFLNIGAPLHLLLSFL